MASQTLKSRVRELDECLTARLDRLTGSIQTLTHPMGVMSAVLTRIRLRWSDWQVSLSSHVLVLNSPPQLRLWCGL